MKINILFVYNLIKGGGVQPDLFVQLVFEIAVVQYTRTHYQTFERVVDPNRPPVPAVWPRPYLVHIWPNYTKHIYSKSGLDKKLISYEPKFGRFQPINRSKKQYF